MNNPNLKKILILFAHPALEKSRVNLKLTEAARGIDGVSFHDLYQAYPNFHIDVDKEQELLSQHDIIIFHHPFFWYSMPALLKEWQDLVLEHGWAYGSQGHALDGKLFLNVITTGGKEIAYNSEGKNRFSVRQLLAPVEQTANLCRMIYLAPFLVHGTHSITPEEILQYKNSYRELLLALRDDLIDIDVASKANRINEPGLQVIKQPEIQ